MHRVAIVTGGGRGIGRAAAIALSEQGWSVVVAGRTAATLAESVALLATPGLAVETDVRRETEVDLLFATTVHEFGRVDLLFNNAGTSAPATPVDELPVDDWESVIAVNLTGSYLCARAAFAQMRRQDPSGGRIINNGSISATTPRPFSAPYTASKHAITGLTKSLNLDGRDHNIAVGQIDIGNASSDMTARMEAGILQSTGEIRQEPTMAVEHVADAVVHMAALPLDVNVLSMTVMANGMPFVGRG
jgi:NAD(P)-dependent dehydrogenase (short-subunit alcohol dehydrogenase family)